MAGFQEESMDLEGAHKRNSIWKGSRVEQRANPNCSAELWAVLVGLLLGDLTHLFNSIDGKHGILCIYNAVLQRKKGRSIQGARARPKVRNGLAVLSLDEKKRGMDRRERHPHRSGPGSR